MGLDHLGSLAVDLDAFIDAVASGPLDAPIDGCPGWTLAALGAHLGDVHRWVLGALATGAPPRGDDLHPAPEGRDPLVAWLRDGADRLLGELAALDPAAPTWHPFPVLPKRAGLWRRRQAQEASVHRWDAEHACGRSASIALDLAADGVDEYLTVMLPRLLLREGRATPGSRLCIVLTDTGHRWVVDGRAGLPALLPTGVEADAEVRGDAASVLLTLWGRPAPQPVSTDGDAAATSAWLGLGGA